MHLVLFSLFAVDLLGTLAGMFFGRPARLNRKITAVSSGVMLGVGLFWILPDMISINPQGTGVIHSLLSVAVAVAALYAVDRFIYPVCPCCSHESHSRCQPAAQALWPLVIAIGVHNLFDGWTAGIAIDAGGMLRSGIAAGLIVHKIPEGLVFGMLLRSASRNRHALTLSAVATGSCILIGAALHEGPKLFPASLVMMLSTAIACASFIFVGLHSFQRQWKEAGMKPALLFLTIGIAGTVVIERGLAFVLGARS